MGSKSLQKKKKKEVQAKSLSMKIQLDSREEREEKGSLRVGTAVKIQAVKKISRSHGGIRMSLK